MNHSCELSRVSCCYSALYVVIRGLKVALEQVDTRERYIEPKKAKMLNVWSCIDASQDLQSLNLCMWRAGCV